MTDDVPNPDLESNNLVERGPDGDPLPQGTRMIEVESLERVIEGLKMAADSCARLAVIDERSAELAAQALGAPYQRGEAWQKWNLIRANLDGVCKHAGELAREGAVFHETPIRHGGVVGEWKEARDRLTDGVMQAAGGARQMATCHRGDMNWHNCAKQLETMQEKLAGKGQKRSPLRGKLWTPDKAWLQ